VAMLSAEDAWRMLHEADLIVPEGEVQQAVQRVASAVSLEYQHKYPLVLCVMNGAVFFCAQLLPLLRFPLHLGYVHASRYAEGISGGGVRWKAEPSEEVRGRHVLVVDDILDVGETLAAIKHKVEAGGALSCKVAVLTDKSHGNSKTMTADYIGIEIPDRFVFGCGLDAYGVWRNLPAIYAIKEG
jgi:hypoxanthine phosphoribosyltransferase